MSITRVGTNQRYAAGWEKAFGGRKKTTLSERAGAIVQKKAAVPGKKQGSKKKATRKSR